MYTILRLKSFSLVFFLMLSLPHIGLARPQACTDLFKKNEIFLKLNFSESNLQPPEINSDEPTVDFVGVLPDGNVLLKKVKKSWLSSYDYYKQATPQADPRFPIFLFGIELAHKMGFQIGTASDGNTYMIAPGALKLEKWIRRVNTLLREKGQEPISYIPTKSGYVTSDQVLELVTKKDEDIKLFFPYEDNNQKLTIHEISFHLGAILFPRKFIERGHDINIRTQQFIQYLKSRKDEMGLVTDVIVNQIQINRGYENDAGTANITGNLGYIRALNDFRPYSRISPELFSEKNNPTVKSLLLAVEFYARPYVSPLAAVVTGLHLMTGVDLTGLTIFPKNSDATFNIQIFPNTTIYRKVVLTSDQLVTLRKIIIDFVNIHKAEENQKQYEISSPDEWLQFILNGFDSRINQLLEINDIK